MESRFRPLLAEKIALSPDGRQVAFTKPAGRDLAIVIMGLESPGSKWTVKVDAGRDAAGADDGPPQLRFLRWATNRRIVLSPVERIVPLPPIAAEDGRLVPNPDGPTVVSPILVIDVDTRQRGTLVDSRDFTETSVDAVRTPADLLRTPQELAALRKEPVRWRMPYLDILGFLPRDPEQLIIQTRGGYSMPMQHLVDIRTGSVRRFGGEWPAPPGDPQVYDHFRLKVVGRRSGDVRPATVWHDEELGRIQRELDLKFPRRSVELLEWSESRGRVLFRVTGGSDPGRLFVFLRHEDLVLEILRRAPRNSKSATPVQ